MEHRLPVLMGRRVLLREPTQADGEHLFAYTTDPLITQFLAFESPRTIEDTLQFIHRCEDTGGKTGQYVFVIADRGSDIPRGVTALRHLDPPARTAQIGTWVRRQDWGGGVNAEAKALLLDYAFNVLDLHRIEARIAITNHRSRRAFERLGGRREGTLKESFYKDGAFQDQGLYAILSSDWQSRGGGAALLHSLPDAGTDA